MVEIISLYFKNFNMGIKDIFYFISIWNIALFFWPITFSLLWLYTNLKIFLFVKKELTFFFTLKNLKNSGEYIQKYIKEKIKLKKLTYKFTNLNRLMPLNILELANRSKFIKNYYFILFGKIKNFFTFKFNF